MISRDKGHDTRAYPSRTHTHRTPEYHTSLSAHGTLSKPSLCCFVTPHKYTYCSLGAGGPYHLSGVAGDLFGAKQSVLTGYQSSSAAAQHQTVLETNNEDECNVFALSSEGYGKQGEAMESIVKDAMDTLPKSNYYIYDVINVNCKKLVRAGLWLTVDDAFALEYIDQERAEMNDEGEEVTWDERAEEESEEEEEDDED